MPSIIKKISHLGICETMSPQDQRRSILSNISSILGFFVCFSIALAFLSQGSFIGFSFCFFIALTLSFPLVLSFFELSHISHLFLIVLANLGGLSLTIFLGKEVFIHQGFLILSLLPWFFFTFEKDKFLCLFFAIIPAVSYFLVHFGFFDGLKTISLPQEEIVILQGSLGIIFILAASALVFFLASEQAKSEKKIFTYRAKSIHAMKLASLGEMAGGIAHEINNPLTVISNSMSLLRKSQEKGKLTDQTLSRIIHEVEQTLRRIASIVYSLRIVSRDSSSIYKKNFPTKELVQDILALCQEKFRSHGVVFKTNMDNPNEFPEYIYGDRVQLSQVLLNFSGNSFDAIEDLSEKWIELNITEKDTFVEIQFRDSGCGIPLEIEEKMFQPFYTSKEIGKGTGLGLSISKNIIDSHGGEIQIDRTKKNTTFVIKLPKLKGAVDSYSA